MRIWGTSCCAQPGSLGQVAIGCGSICWPPDPASAGSEEPRPWPDSSCSWLLASWCSAPAPSYGGAATLRLGEWGCISVVLIFKIQKEQKNDFSAEYVMMTSLFTRNKFILGCKYTTCYLCKTIGIFSSSLLFVRLLKFTHIFSNLWWEELTHWGAWNVMFYTESGSSELYINGKILNKTCKVKCLGLTISLLT